MRIFPEYPDGHRQCECMWVEHICMCLCSQNIVYTFIWYAGGHEQWPDQAVIVPVLIIRTTGWTQKRTAVYDCDVKSLFNSTMWCTYDPIRPEDKSFIHGKIHQNTIRFRLTQNHDSNNLLAFIHSFCGIRVPCKNNNAMRWCSSKWPRPVEMSNIVCTKYTSFHNIIGIYVRSRLEFRRVSPELWTNANWELIVATIISQRRFFAKERMI